MADRPSNFRRRDLIGHRGERIAELCLTDHQSLAYPLFQVAVLGDKWPAIDLFVQLSVAGGRRPYLFAQVKSTAATLRPSATHLTVSVRSADVAGLLQIPGPTYLLAVHEPSHRVFARAVHAGVTGEPLGRVRLANELTDANRVRLYHEVHAFWATPWHKPLTSEFT